MARPRYPKSTGPLPPPLPPVARTVGQLVAETLKVYGGTGRRGCSSACRPLCSAASRPGSRRTETLAVVPFVGAVAATASFVMASAIVGGVGLRSRAVVPAAIVGVLVYLPFPFLAAVFVLPGLAWFALIGLAVPGRADRVARRPGRAPARASSSAGPTTSMRSAASRR